MKTQSLDVMKWLVWLAVCSVIDMAVLAQTDIKDIPVSVSQGITEVPATNACIILNERERFYSSLPYRKGADNFQMFSTLGQLSKLCDWVVIGSLTNLVKNNDGRLESKSFGNWEITINVETNLFGRCLEKQLSAKLSWFNVQQELKQGDRMILFIAKSSYDKYRQKQLSFNFSKTNLVGKASDELFVLEGSRGVVQLDGRTDEKEMSVTIQKYLQALRLSSDRKPLDYYLLLTELAHSQNNRIRKDAISDLILLLQLEKSIDLQKIVEDPEILPEVKDFIRLILLPPQASK